MRSISPLHYILLAVAGILIVLGFAYGGYITILLLRDVHSEVWWAKVALYHIPTWILLDIGFYYVRRVKEGYALGGAYSDYVGALRRKPNTFLGMIFRFLSYDPKPFKKDSID